MSGALEIRAARADEAVARDAFTLAHPRGAPFALAGWGRAVERVFRHAPRDFVALRDGELVGLLPLMRCCKLTGGSDLISVPYGVYGGPLGADAEVERALVDAARALAERRKVGRLELRCREDQGLEELTPSDLYVTFRKTMPADPAEVVLGMKKDERRLVRRARDTHALELVEGREHTLELARLFHASKRRLGSPGLPLAWFEALQDELGAHCVVHAARRAGETLAVCMCFVARDEILMYYIGTEPEANREFATTSFMIAGLQEWAIARGLRVFDLGRSRKDAGAVGFKLNQGFVPEPLHYRYHLVRSRSTPTFTPSNPRTERLRNTWSRLPEWMTERLSARLARYLP